MHNPEATAAALKILRSGEPFQWYVITLLALVVYVYVNEISKKNRRGVAAGLCLYMIHWLFEIVNALIGYFSGHALWTVPQGTAFLFLVGVGVEISLMFSLAGLIFSKLLPADPRIRILGVNNRLAIGVAGAALFAGFEVFLARTPAFVWVYPWWGAASVFVLVYIPFFVPAMYCYDWRPTVQRRVISGLLALNVALLVVFAGLLKWI